MASLPHKNWNDDSAHVKTKMCSRHIFVYVWYQNYTGKMHIIFFAFKNMTDVQICRVNIWKFIVEFRTLFWFYYLLIYLKFCLELSGYGLLRKNIIFKKHKSSNVKYFVSSPTRLTCLTPHYTQTSILLYRYWCCKTTLLKI